MRTISPDLSNHLNGTATTICRCWKITRRDGLILGFTECDEELELDGVIYQPMTGLNSTVAESSIGLNSNTVEVLGALTSQRLSEEDIRSDKYDGAIVEVLVVNWSSPQENLLENVYSVGEITEEDGLFKAELRTLESALDQTGGEHFVHQCQADLGDSRCSIDLDVSSYKGAGTIASYDGLRQLTVIGLEAFSDGWFEGGLLTFVSGENAGMSIEVSRHTDAGSEALLQLWKMLPGSLNTGDAFEITAGCDKKFATCKAKFANHLNFRGFPHLPGQDFAHSYVSNSGNLDGGIIVQ